MADVEKGARPKDSKTVESQNMGDIIKSLEREEKDLWSPAGKGLTSWLSFVVSSVSLSLSLWYPGSLSLWYPGSGVVLDCIDSCSLQPYYFERELKK